MQAPEEETPLFSPASPVSGEGEVFHVPSVMDSPLGMWSTWKFHYYIFPGLVYGGMQNNAALASFTAVLVHLTDH